MATSPSSTNGTLSPADKRRASILRSQTAPNVMAVNGHFASVGQNGKIDNFEHGIQVIDEDKEFKSVPSTTALQI